MANKKQRRKERMRRQEHQRVTSTGTKIKEFTDGSKIEIKRGPSRQPTPAERHEEALRQIAGLKGPISRDLRKEFSRLVRRCGSIEAAKAALSKNIDQHAKKGSHVALNMQARGGGKTAAVEKRIGEMIPQALPMHPDTFVRMEATRQGITADMPDFIKGDLSKGKIWLTKEIAKKNDALVVSLEGEQQKTLERLRSTAGALGGYSDVNLLEFMLGDFSAAVPEDVDHIHLAIDGGAQVPWARREALLNELLTHEDESIKRYGQMIKDLFDWSARPQVGVDFGGQQAGGGTYTMTSPFGTTGPVPYNQLPTSNQLEQLGAVSAQKIESGIEITMTGSDVQTVTFADGTDAAEPTEAVWAEIVAEARAKKKGAKGYVIAAKARDLVLLDDDADPKLRSSWCIG